MFKWLNKQGVESDRGFILQFTGRFSMEYREGSKTLTLVVEGGISGGRAFISVCDPIRSWDDGPVLSSSERDRIVRNIREALEFQDLGTDI